MSDLPLLDDSTWEPDTDGGADDAWEEWGDSDNGVDDHQDDSQWLSPHP